MTKRRLPRDQIPVVILCGGQGTRIREETERIPKPLVDIGGRPILWHIMKIYGHQDFRRFILCLGYKGWEIKQYFLRYREHVADFTIHLSNDHRLDFHNQVGEEDWEVTCVETGLLTATGARIYRARDYLTSDTFMLTYGDGVADIDIDRLLEFHYDEGRLGTITGVHPTSRYGEMRVEGRLVSEFNEKPTRPEGFVSGGFFVFQKEFFNYLNDDPGLFFEYEPLQKLARDGELSVYPHEGFWMGMDTYREYLTLNQMWQSGKAPWKIWEDGDVIWQTGSTEASAESRVAARGSSRRAVDPPLPFE
jgi:glucose-1-phosphate cytidylyltransferase